MVKDLVVVQNTPHIHERVRVAPLFYSPAFPWKALQVEGGATNCAGAEVPAFHEGHRAGRMQIAIRVGP